MDIDFEQHRILVFNSKYDVLKYEKRHAVDINNIWRSDLRNAMLEIEEIYKLVNSLKKRWILYFYSRNMANVKVPPRGVINESATILRTKRRRHLSNSHMDALFVTLNTLYQKVDDLSAKYKRRETAIELLLDADVLSKGYNGVYFPQRLIEEFRKESEEGDCAPWSATDYMCSFRADTLILFRWPPGLKSYQGAGGRREEERKV